MIRLLVWPSLLSGILCCLLAAIIIGWLSWSYISQNQLFYETLFGPRGVATALVISNDLPRFLQQSVFNSQATYYIGLVVVAVTIGILVYELLQGVGKLARSAEQGVYESALKEALGRLAIRVVSVAAWAVYFVIFFSMLVPFIGSMTSSGVEAVVIGDISGWLWLLGATLLLAAALHTHIIFVRLVTQRLRIFGSPELEYGDV